MCPRLKGGFENAMEQTQSALAHLFSVGIHVQQTCVFLALDGAYLEKRRRKWGVLPVASVVAFLILKKPLSYHGTGSGDPPETAQTSFFM